MKHYLPDLLSGLLTARKAKTADSEAESRFLQYTVICCAGLIAMVVFGIYNILERKYILSVLIFVSGAGLASGWVLLFRGLAEKFVYQGNAFLFYILLVYLMYLGGEENSKILWVNISPLITFFLLGRKDGLIWISSLFLVAIILLFNLFGLQNAHSYSLTFSSRFLVTFSIISVISYYYENFRHIYRADLETKNNRLLEEINERQKVESSLRESEARYRTIYLHAAEGILLINFQGDIVECNPQILAMLGYQERDVVGRNIFSLFHPEDLERLPPQIDKLRSGEVLFIERRMRTASGVYLLYEQSGKKINEDLIILLYRDITERKIAELALERANEALDRLAHFDGLTHIANRRKFDQVIKAEWQRMKREGKQLGLILCDIDFFKQFNDIYGHQAGDDCLRSVASALSSVVHRPADMVARYGGEEFVVLLPDTDYEGCRKIAEKMRNKIESLRINHKGSKVHSFVTMSFGVALISPIDIDEQYEVLIAAADKALYLAKEGGRNQVS